MIDRSIPKSSMLSESPSIGISNPEVHPSIGTSSTSCGCAVLLLRLFFCAVLLLRLSRVTEGSASNTVLLSKPLSLARQEYLYKNIQKFVDDPFQDVMCPKPIK